MTLSTSNPAGLTAGSSSIPPTPSSSTADISLAPVYPATPSRSRASSACNSAHPSPSGTLTRSPSLDATTPRSLKQFDPRDAEEPAATTTTTASGTGTNDDNHNNEPVESPFFAGWDRKASAKVGHEDVNTPSTDDGADDELHTPDVFSAIEQKRYSLTSSSATSSLAPLYASATSPLFPHSHSQDPSPSASSNLIPAIRSLQISTTPTTPQGWPAPMSPLPMDAVAPSAPKMGSLPTPVMSPRNSLPTTPALSYLRNRSPLQHDESANNADNDDEPTTIHSLLDIQRKLPLPGQLEDEDITISSALLIQAQPQATRSDSVDSISSVLNDTGHDTTTPPNEGHSLASEPLYTGSAFIHEVNAPPLQSLSTSISVERALPLPPSKHPSDPPLIPSLRRPDLMHLVGEATSSFQRPISPFSPTLPLYTEHTGASNTTPKREQRTRKRTLDSEQDLINFDSDSESASPDIYDQYAGYRENEGDSIYLAQNYSTHQFGMGQNDGVSASSSNEDEEEEDYSSHALYSTLSTSDSPYVRRAWEGSNVILVPSRNTLSHAFLSSSKQWNGNTSLETPEMWERFTAVHALRQEAGSPDHYVGFGETSDGLRLHARLDSENQQVQISLKQELDSAAASTSAFNEFGMTIHPSSQALSRHTVSSGMTTSAQSQAIPPHLLVSSPSSSVESGNFPTTPPLSSEMAPSLPSKVSSSGSSSTPRLPEAIAFPSIEQAQKYSQTPLSPTRRLNIVHEKVIYRKRRVQSAVSTSAPSAMPSPPAMSRDSSATSHNSAVSAAAQVNSIQQATDRLSKLSTPSMQSISSLASVSTNNGKTVKKKDSKVRLRVPKWLGGGRSRDSISGVKITESAPSTPIVPQEQRQATIQEEVQLVIEKVRLIQVDSFVIEWPGEETIDSPREFRRSMPLSNRQSQQSFAARMHRKSSQPLAGPSYSQQQQDATIRERRSFHHPPFSATFADAQEPMGTSGSVTSVRMGSRHDSNASHSSCVSRRSSMALRMKHTSQASSTPGAVRDFSSDIAYLLEPPKYLEHFSGLFEQSLKLIIRSSKDFAERFYYIRGQEQEAVARLRTEVLDEVWQYFADEEAIHGLRHHLLDIFENATMAFAHDYVYSKTIKPSYSHHEMDFGNVINVYRVHTITMADFGISSGYYSEAAFAPVIDILSELCGSGVSRQELWEKMPPQSYKRLVQLISQTTDSASTVIALLEARTPLDTIAHLRKAIDELVKATSSSDSGHEEKYNRLATDDLIPILSWAIVKANAKSLPSLLFYAKMFRLATHKQADSEWTIVQFEAAMAYLSTDPLRLQKNSASPSPAIQSQSVSPVQPIFLRTVSEDSLGLPARSRRSSVHSLPPESARTASRSPSQQTHLASYHKRTLSSLPSTRMALYQAAGRPSSIVSAVTTEEDEDNAEMGPPAPPKKDGSADGHDLLSASMSAVHRYRSTSPPIHRPVAVRPPRRPFHLAHDQPQGPNQLSRVPLGRSQTTPLNGTVRPPSFPGNRASVELNRAGSDGSRRGSLDWWGPLRYAVASSPASPPVGSEGALSSRPDSPASPAVKSVDRHSSARSSFDLERSTSDIGWVEWGRRRLSSMTSSTSLVDSAEGGRSVAEQIAEKIAASAARGGSVPTADRSRRKSESAATALSPSQFEDATSEIQAIAAPSVAEPPSSTSINARSLTSAGSRPRSTLSLSSTSSLDTDASLNRSANTATAPVAGRHQFRNSIAGPPGSYASHSSNLSRSRRFRKELRSANLGSSMALPQLQLDTASASALTGLGQSQRPSSLHLDAALGSGLGSSAFYPSYSLSHTTSRLGTTPFSPIQEIAPTVHTYYSSPEQVMRIKPPVDVPSDESVPPTPRDLASATGRPWSQPTP